MTKIKSLINSKSKSSKFNSNKNYSSFWMNDNDFYSGSNSRWGGLSGTVKGSTDTVKVIKLQSYRKAITNFVKILTKKDIPVYFAGDTSYTDFNKVVLSTDIKDDNFDVAVGLALHEASHLILTDREYLPKMMSDPNFRYSAHNDMIQFGNWKNLLNWIEDRRIDQYIFATSPGYKAYYHKMYDHYWNSPSITKGLQSSELRDPKSMSSWMFRIVNSLNPAADINALPRLAEVLQLIDTKSIKRLKSTADAGEVAAQVLDVILSFMDQAKNPAPKPEDKVNPNPGSESTNDEQEQEPQDNGDEDFGENERKGGKDLDEQSTGDDTDTEESDSTNGAGEETDEETAEDQESANGAGEEEDQPKDLSAAESAALAAAIKKQKDFMNGEVNKTVGNKSLTNKLKATSGSNAELQQVGEGTLAATAIVYDLTKDSTLMQLADLYAQYANATKSSDKNVFLKSIEELESILPAGLACGRHCADTKIETKPDAHEWSIPTAIHKGLEMGALLGRKMQIRSESRELVTNRMNTGHIDNKRLAQAGFGIENIFKQVTVDKYKKANLHISLDASGSMGGSKWNNTIMMTTAICKAVSMIQNLEVQVSLRITDGNTPVIVTIYDSRKNKLRHLTSAFSVASTNFTTPEGLCFDAQIKKNLLVPGNKEMDSFFLNISDGQPGGCGNYYGPKAVEHTRKQINKLRELNINILGFFMTGNSGANSSDMANFNTMYGVKDSKQVKASDAMQIAKAMNELFMKRS